MANPIAFKPAAIDPALELQGRLAAAQREHAEALLAAYNLLGEAHRQGILDALNGAIGARDTIAGILASYAAQKQGINAMRNLLAFGKLLGAIDPAPLSRFSEKAYVALETHQQEKAPPTFWQLLRRLGHPDTRRGLSLLLMMLSGVGRASR
jgi:uncharacterized protein YjgD (DUF1641 family)